MQQLACFIIRYVASIHSTSDERKHCTTCPSCDAVIATATGEASILRKKKKSQMSKKFGSFRNGKIFIKANDCVSIRLPCSITVYEGIECLQKSPSPNKAGSCTYFISTSLLNESIRKEKIQMWIKSITSLASAGSFSFFAFASKRQQRCNTPMRGKESRSRRLKAYIVRD